eukprot:TRINITY_DN8073_c0_g1_i1.p1 TRINITY_DN8073_c0_g1~~TRINITY_DN8073_c0_g1_i1.p1  ORF type:complete len:190 (+),score=28.59 TRINITY_DN8073_c0_g1_i1:263-832(+)
MVEGPLATVTRYGGGVIQWIASLQSKQANLVDNPTTSSSNLAAVDEDVLYDNDIHKFHHRFVESFSSSRGRQQGPPPHASILLRVPNTPLVVSTTTATKEEEEGQQPFLPVTPLPDIFITFSRSTTTTMQEESGDDITTTSTATATASQEDPITRFFHRNNYELLESHLHTTIVVDEGSGHWLEIWGRK